MSEVLMKGLMTTKRDIEAGIADAEAELARTEEYCRKLEELIAVGKATLLAASQLNFQNMQRESTPAATTPATSVTDIQGRLAKDAQK